MNKKLMLTAAVVLTAVVTFARPHGGGPMGGGPRPGPAPAFHHRGPMPGGPHHGGSFWGRGGRNFWSGLAGGIVGAAAYNAMVTPRTYYYNTGYVRPAPVVVAPQPTTVYTTPSPVVYTQPTTVTVPTTTYVTQPVTVTPNVYRRWVPGRYEYQTINGVTTRIFIPGHYEAVAY